MDPKEYQERMKIYEAMADVEVEDLTVSEPSHYTQFAIEPKEFIVRNGLEFWRGNIIKYACRAGSKSYEGLSGLDSEIRDLKKAIRYAEMRINQIKGNYSL